MWTGTSQTHSHRAKGGCVLPAVTEGEAYKDHMVVGVQHSSAHRFFAQKSSPRATSLLNMLVFGVANRRAVQLLGYLRSRPSNHIAGPLLEEGLDIVAQRI